MPKAIRDRRTAGSSVGIADLFQALPDLRLRVGVVASDGYSGTRSYVEHEFLSSALKPGRFIGNGCEHAPTEDWLPGD
jgi:hypothetical protein